MAAPEVEHAYARARELCQQVGRPRSSSRCCGGCGTFIWCGRSYRRRGSWGSNSSPWPSMSTTRRSSWRPTMRWGHTLIYLGEFAAAQAHLEQGMALYDPQQHRAHAFRYGQDPGVVCRSYARRDPVVAGLSGPGPAAEPRGADPGPGAGAPLQPGMCPDLCGLAPSVPPGGAR